MYNYQESPDIVAVLATNPTGALAGSKEKIEEMRARAERGEHLFHPDDAEGCVLQRDQGRTSVPRFYGRVYDVGVKKFHVAFRHRKKLAGGE